MHFAAKPVAHGAPDRQLSGSNSAAVAMAWNYAVALLLVAMAALIAYPFRAQIYTTPLFLAAVVISAWYGGVGPGALAVFASIGVIHYVFQLQSTELTRPHHDVARLAEFVFIGGIVTAAIAARKRAERSLRRARDELEQKVIERTADLKKANEQLRDSEEQWKATFECNPTMYFMVNSAGITVSVNAFGAEQLGYKRNELVGQPLVNLFHEADREMVRKNVEDCFNHLGQTFRWEARKYRKDRTLIWVRETANALLLKHRPMVLVVCEDITGRKRAEEALLQSEKQLRDLIETIPAMAFVTRADGSNEFVSRPWIEFSGLSAEQSAGAGWEAVLHPDDARQHLAKWRLSSSSGEPFENEARHRDAHGNYRWLLVSAVPLRDKQGDVLKWYGTAIDVEDRKRAEQALQQSEAYLAEAQRLTHTGSFVWDIRTKQALYLSDEWYRIYGFDREKEPDAFDKRFERIPTEDRARWQAAVDRAITEKSDYDLEYRLVLPDGTTKYVLAIGHPVSNSSGEVVQFMGSVTDITERKRAEALLAGEKRLLEMIATGVPLKEILNALCFIIEEQRHGTLASVLLLNPDGVHLDVIAGPNLPTDWTRQMEQLPIGPCAGSCGTAAYRRERVIVSDIAADPLWDVPDHRTSALEHGLRASWSNPVVSSKGKVLGTFCMYYRESRTPTAEDLGLIELATHLARVAIERDHAEEALRKSEQLARSHVEVMMRSLDLISTEAAPEKYLGEMLRAIGQHLHANRVMLWVRDQRDDSLRLHLAIEQDRQVPAYPDHPFVKDPQRWKKVSLIQEMLFTKSPVVVDDTERDPRIEPEFREYLARARYKKFMVIPMFVSGEMRGYIGIQHIEQGAYRAEEVELAQALAHHVMLALHGQEVGEQQRQAAILKERTRMARDIHDTLAQGFTGVVVQMEAAEEALLEEDPENVVRHVRRARELARESLGEARRSVHALRPQALEKAAFADALKAIIKNTTAGTSLRADFRIKGKPRELGSAVEENLLHIGQEALSNALKHAHATNFQARLAFDSDAVRLELRDNGEGFLVDTVNGEGFGLIGMKERAEQIGATLEVSSEPGGGTRITAVSPYQTSPSA
jgi:PAS domain S-box-containing protein